MLQVKKSDVRKVDKSRNISFTNTGLFLFDSVSVQQKKQSRLMISVL